MSDFWPKQRASRPILSTLLTSSSSPIKAGSETYQLRVAASAASALSVLDSSTLASSTVAVPINASTVGEYFAISPGQWYFLYGTALLLDWDRRMREEIKPSRETAELIAKRRELVDLHNLLKSANR